MKPKKLKTPADYPQFYCRMTKVDQTQIETMISSIQDKVGKRLKKDERIPKRNEIIAEALKLGLEAIFEKINKQHARS